MSAAPTVTVTDVTGGVKVTAVNNEQALGARMLYTTTGVDPVSTDDEWPEDGVTIDEAGTTTFKVASFVGTSKGAVTTKDVTVVKLTAPTITPGDNSFTIEGNDAEVEADLYYRFGTSGSWSKYTEAVAITETVTVQAYAKKKGYVDSETAEQEVEYVSP